MYIRRIEINNIRSIEHFEMTFPEGKEAGWHVLIGDNGSGKSTIVRSAALTLLGQPDIRATREDWENWLSKGKKSGQITVSIIKNPAYDYDEFSNSNNEILTNKVSFVEIFEPNTSINESNDENLNSPISHLKILGIGYVDIDEIITRNEIAFKRDSTINTSYTDQTIGGWFSVAYGPFRRFTGGSSDKEFLYKTNPRLGAHLSIFGEEVALSEALAYLRELYIKDSDNQLNKRKNNIEGEVLHSIKRFINEAKLLPHNTTINQLSPNQVTFKDANGNQISAIQLSDGYRSILSMTFELIRQLIKFYGHKLVFRQIDQNNMLIDLPGVVLIDEVDAHLHPTWQTDIGQWFTKYFPNLQFIVTTHSPLVCRAAEKGSIWRLPSPGSDEGVQEITGDEKKRLVFGNVLDAYGTNAFGDNVARSESANDKLNELAELNIKSIMGQISPDEEQQLNELRSIFPTEG
ncbi:AAA family ATPase [soil metagenome]